MDSLPAFGAILKNHFKLNTKDDARSYGDLYAAALDYLIRQAWSYLGLFEAEEEKHREGLSILEVQSFLEWAMSHLIEDAELDVAELDKEAQKAVEEFKNSGGNDDEN